MMLLEAGEVTQSDEETMETVTEVTAGTSELKGTLETVTLASANSAMMEVKPGIVVDCWTVSECGVANVASRWRTMAAED
jgi:hypothetical protein